jgi:glycosyltransferase involved in cell wall biosynthesis
MDKKTLGIFQVNTNDCTGGAARIAWNLFKAFENMGCKSFFVVGNKQSADPNVLQILHYENRKISDRLNIFFGKKGKNSPILRSSSHYYLNLISHPLKTQKMLRGCENFDFLGTWDLLNLVPSFKPNIIHCHNLHGEYFDLRALPSLCDQVPVVLTLHDAWLLSGHCAHSFECEKWKTGCGNCPDISIPPAIRKDATAYNWRQKKEIFTKSHLYVATPCQWLMDKVKKSILAPAIVESKVIPNGVDLSVFHPFDKQKARKELGLSDDSTIIIFAANGIRDSIWKDYQTMRLAIAYVSKECNSKDLVFIALGEKANSEKIGKARINFVPYQLKAEKVARYYQAADVYIHAARAETFPNTILEALACGTPAVATSVGGIPEQIIDNETGFLTPQGDAEGMAEKIRLLIEDDNLRKVMGNNGFYSVKNKFGLEKQINEYLNWYHKILNR